MKYFIRDFREEDMGNVSSLYVEVFREPPWFANLTDEYVKRKIRSWQSEKSLMFLLAEWQRQIIGFRVAYELDPEKFSFLPAKDIEKSIYGKELAVRKDFRNSGVGTAMMEETFFMARSRDYRRFWGRTNIDSRMVPLYKELGYTATGMRDPEFPEREYFVKDITQQINK